MLIEAHNTLTETLRNIKLELRRAANDRKHPMRFCTFITGEAAASGRYVVLRAIDNDFNILIYTDHRSEKVRKLESNEFAQIVCYHPKKRAQIIITGKAAINHQNKLAKEHWKNILGEGVKSYTSILKPGTKINNPLEAHQWEQPNDQYFTVIKVSPTQIEALQLNQQKHYRVLFTKVDSWEGQWLAP